MALKKHEQAQLDMIQKSLDMLVNIGGMSNEDMLQHLNPMIVGFENETNMKVVITPTENGSQALDVVDLKKDFVRSRWNPGETLQGLRAKSLGIPIEVKVTKKDDFVFSNKQIASALHELAESISTLDVEFYTLGLADLERAPGEHLRVKLGDIASDDDDDNDNADTLPDLNQASAESNQVALEQNQAITGHQTQTAALQQEHAPVTTQNLANEHLQTQSTVQQTSHEQNLQQTSRASHVAQNDDLTPPGQ
jgi:hypothetical protein|tara:strand:- start:173 stop:925 length:753 start_codon:yes stop_codon:yes gene_type:complete